MLSDLKGFIRRQSDALNLNRRRVDLEEKIMAKYRKVHNWLYPIKVIIGVDDLEDEESEIHLLSRSDVSIGNTTTNFYHKLTPKSYDIVRANPYILKSMTFYHPHTK